MKPRWMRVLIRIAAVLGSLLVLAVLAVVVRSSWALRAGAYRVGKPVAMEGASAERGAHAVHGIGACAGCHGDDLGGKVVIDEPAFVVLPAPNLTRGRGGLGASLTPDDWERAIRHGVTPDGRALLLMPSDLYAPIDDRDTADMIAYLQSLPPVDRELPPRRAGPFGRLALAMGGSDLLSAARIRPELVGSGRDQGTAVQRGAYFGTTCRGCHGDDLAGRSQPVAPGTPVPANLTQDPSGLAGWTEQDFLTLMRTGKRPDGTAIDDFMPWRSYGHLSDDELASVWAWLRSLPPKPHPPVKGG